MREANGVTLSVVDRLWFSLAELESKVDSKIGKVLTDVSEGEG